MDRSFRLVGTFAVTVGGRQLTDAEVGSRKGRQLLKLLVVERGRTVGVDRIVEALWADRAPTRPVDNVATLVSRLRATLGPAIVVGARGGYRLAPDAGTVDLDEADALLTSAEAVLAGLTELAGHAAQAGLAGPTGLAGPAGPAGHAGQAGPAGDASLAGQAGPAGDAELSGRGGLAVAASARALAILDAGAVLADEADAGWAEPARAQAAELLRRGRHVAAAAALAAGEPAAAGRHAERAVAADPLDEPAYRLLMLAHSRAGEPARALAAYERLRALLAAELGVDPAPATRRLHLAVLRGEPIEPDPPVPARPPPPVSALVGRDAERDRLARAWAAATAGRPALLLITGVAGIGKTSLAAEAAALARTTGGLVLQARCYDTERSLFLQPLVEAVRAELGRLSPAAVAELAGAAAAALAGLISEAAERLGEQPVEAGPPDVQRRRAFEALTGFLRGLAGRAPVLLLLDDLHAAGLATVEYLHYLARHAGPARLLVVATVRDVEGGEALDRLAEVADRLPLGPLPPAAVAELAGAAGHPELADRIARRTRGHPLFVVETLRGLSAGETGTPASLQAAVEAAVRRAGAPAAEALRAAAVLGPPFTPAGLAAVLGIDALAAARHCEHALRSALVVVAGPGYEFANDLVQEVLYATTPEPTRVEYHRRAAEVLADRPEAVAVHAAAAGDWLRAARAGLVAAEQALRRCAFSDAERLLDPVLAAAGRAGGAELLARGRLTRGRAREALARYDEAWADLEAAAELAREAGDPRLEMLALRELGGDVPIARGRPSADCEPYLLAGIRLARGLGDRAVEADLLARTAVLASNQLRFDRAQADGARAVAAARAAQDEQALASALDGQKTAHAYLGDLAGLAPVLAELAPLLRRRGDLWRLQWAVFESAFGALAAGDWDAAVSGVDGALEVNRRSGYLAYRPWFQAHRGWVERLRGRYDDALRWGRAALTGAEEGGHPWWVATAAGFLGSTLLAVGERAEAAEVLAGGLAAAEVNGAAGYRLRCLAPLAEATGDPATVAAAAGMLAAITAPPGAAWLLGSDTYLALARGWLGLAEPARALAVLDPLLAAAEREGWVGPLAAGSLLAGRCAADLGDTARARQLLDRGHQLADRHGMPTD
jgi:DNA-binding SARP family transcriptional activator